MHRRSAICIRRKDFKQLEDYLFQRTDVESGAVAFYRCSESPRLTKLLVRAITLPRDEDYQDRSAGLVTFTPEFIARCHEECERTETNLLDIHTHPFQARPSFSSIDDREAYEVKIPYLEQWVPGVGIAFVVFGDKPTAVDARFWDESSEALQPIHHIRII